MIMMDVIRCPFCSGTEGARKTCDKCDEEGLFDLPNWAAHMVRTLTDIIGQAALERIGGMVIVIENHDGSDVESYSLGQSYSLGHTMRSKGSDTLERIAKNSRKAWEEDRIKTIKAKLEASWRCRIGRNEDGKLAKIDDGDVRNSAHLYYNDYEVRRSLCELTLVAYGLSQEADEDDMAKRCELCEKAMDTLLAEQKDDDGHQT